MKVGEVRKSKQWLSLEIKKFSLDIVVQLTKGTRVTCECGSSICLLENYFTSIVFYFSFYKNEKSMALGGKKAMT